MSAGGDPQIMMVLDFWRLFDLVNKRSSLDQQGLAIKDAKDRSTASRKTLAEQTKNFRAFSDAEKLAGNNRIHALHYTHSAFFSMYNN